MIRLDPIEFKRNFGTEKQCLEFVHNMKEKSHRNCKKCLSSFNYMNLRRKKFYCRCGNSYSPLKGTIFYRSSTPLVEWFKVIYKFGSTKIGVTSLEVSRSCNVTYKTALRMTHLIRSLFVDSQMVVGSGEFEIDELMLLKKRIISMKAERLSKIKVDQRKQK